MTTDSSNNIISMSTIIEKQLLPFVCFVIRQADEIKHSDVTMQCYCQTCKLTQNCRYKRTIALCDGRANTLFLSVQKVLSSINSIYNVLYSINIANHEIYY